MGTGADGIVVSVDPSTSPPPSAPVGGVPGPGESVGKGAWGLREASSPVPHASAVEATARSHGVHLGIATRSTTKPQRIKE